MRGYFYLDYDKLSNFGNHYQKYFFSLEKYLDDMVERLSKKALIDKINFKTFPDDILYEMNLITGIASNKTQSLNYLACYFAYRFSKMNLDWIELLNKKIKTNEIKSNIYRMLLTRAQENFRKLISCLLSKYIEILGEANLKTEFILLNTGELSDYEDVDIISFISNKKKIPRLNKFLNNLGGEFFKKIVNLHFYFAEYLPFRNFTGTISDYNILLEQEKKNYILISQILGSSLLYGDQDFYEKIQDKIIRRYLYTYENTIYYEGFIRGLLDEVSYLISVTPNPNIINPKSQIYRLVKILLLGLKARYSIKETSNWMILTRLKEINIEREKEYSFLEQALAFSEIFRFLYNLFIFQDSRVDLTDENISSQISNILNIINPREKNSIKLFYEEYTNILAQTQKIAEMIAYDLEISIKKINVFGEIVNKYNKKERDTNFLFEFYKIVSQSKGNFFWDDFIDIISGDKLLLTRIFFDFQELSNNEKLKIISKISNYMARDLKASFSFLNLLFWISKEYNDLTIYEIFLKTIFEKISSDPLIIKKVDETFDLYPIKVNLFIQTTPKQYIYELIKLYYKRENKPDNRTEQRLELLTHIHHDISNYAQRIFDIALNENPNFIRSLDDSDEIDRIAENIFSNIDTINSYEKKKELISHFLFLKFCKLVINLIFKKQNINKEENYYDIFSKKLLNICIDEIFYKEQYDFSYEELIDNFVFLVTGGNARGELFQNDFDMLIVVSSEKYKVFFNKVISKFNPTLTKCSLIPHHRISEFYNSYAITFDELRQLFYEKITRDDYFIDQSELLASRLIAGSEKLYDKIFNEIIKESIFNQKEKFIKSMFNELKIHENYNIDENSFNIKEDPGCSRDIWLFLLILEAKYNIKESDPYKAFDLLKEKNPNNRTELDFLATSFKFLNAFRDIYHLVVSYEDVIKLEYIDYLINLFEKEFWKDIKNIRINVIKSINKIK
jgi:hypothetical protein